MPNAYQSMPYDPTAVMGRRVVAYLIDVFIGLVILFVLLAVNAQTVDVSELGFFDGEDFCDVYNAETFNSTESTGVTQSTGFCFPLPDTAIIITQGDINSTNLAILVYWLLNAVLLAGATGASVGKHIMGLRVIKQSDGTLHGFGAAALRWILWIVDGFFYLFPIVGLITASTSKGHRRVGDMAANTLVVRKSDVGTPPAIFGLTTTVPYPSTPQPQMMPPTATPAEPPYAFPYQPTEAQAPPPPVGYDAPAPPPPGDLRVAEEIAPPASTSNEPPFEDPAATEAPGPEQSANAPESAGPADPGVEAPTWDSQRNTYIQWDPALNEWMEWSAPAQRWIPISQ